MPSPFSAALGSLFHSPSPYHLHTIPHTICISSWADSQSVTPSPSSSFHYQAFGPISLLLLVTSSAWFHSDCLLIIQQLFVWTTRTRATTMAHTAYAECSLRLPSFAFVSPAFAAIFQLTVFLPFFSIPLLCCSCSALLVNDSSTFVVFVWQHFEVPNIFTFVYCVAFCHLFWPLVLLPAACCCLTNALS